MRCTALLIGAEYGNVVVIFQQRLQQDAKERERAGMQNGLDLNSIVEYCKLLLPYLGKTNEEVNLPVAAAAAATLWRKHEKRKKAKKKEEEE